MLTKIIAPDSTTTTYSYNDDGLLTTVTYSSRNKYSANSDIPTQNISRLLFTYQNSNNFDGIYRLKSVHNTESGRETVFNRTHNGKVSSFVTTVPVSVEYVRNEQTYTEVENVSFTYNTSSTKTENNLSDGYYLVYIFNQQGLTTNVADSEGNSKAYEYSQSGESKNKITFASNTRRNTENRIVNGNFHETTGWTLLSGASINTGSGYMSISGGAKGRQSFYPGLSGYYTISVDAKAEYGALAMSLTQGDTVVGYTEARYTDGYEPLYITAFLNSNSEYTLSFDCDSTQCYVTNVQVVNGGSSEQFNWLANSSFDNFLDGWTTENFGYDDTSSGELRMYGDYRTKKMVSQQIGTSFDSGTVFVFGANVKSDSLKNLDIGYGTETHVGMTLCLEYDDGYDYAHVFFEPETNGVSINSFGSMKAEQDVRNVTLHLKYGYNSGYVEFDDVYLYVDSAGDYYTYDSKGNLKSATSQSGNKSTAEYNDYGDITSSTDALGNTTTYAYNVRRNLTSTTTESGIKTEYAYDRYGNVTKTKTTNVNDTSSVLAGTSATYSAYGTQTDTVTDALGTVSVYNVNDITLKTEGIINNFDESTVSGDSYTAYNYYTEKRPDNVTVDDAGPLKSVTVYDSDGETALASVSYDYSKGKLKNINRNGYKYTFDEEVGEYVGDIGNVFENKNGYSYYIESLLADSVGIKKSDDTSYLRLIKNIYDRDGNLISSYQSDNNFTVYKRDIHGRVQQKHTYNDTVKYSYTSKGEVSSVSSENNATTSVYDYDFAGRLSFAKTTHDEKSIIEKSKYTYDKLDRLSSVKYYINNGVYGSNYSEDVTRTDYTYNSDSQLLTQSIYSGETTGTYLIPKLHYAYNNLGLLTQIKYAQTESAGTTGDITRDITYRTNSNGETTSLVTA